MSAALGSPLRPAFEPQPATFISTPKGGVGLYHDGYRYRLRKRQPYAKYWCCVRTDCLGKASSRGGRVVSVTGEHHHPPDHHPPDPADILRVAPDDSLPRAAPRRPNSPCSSPTASPTSGRVSSVRKRKRNSRRRAHLTDDSSDGGPSSLTSDDVSQDSDEADWSGQGWADKDRLQAPLRLVYGDDDVDAKWAFPGGRHDGLSLSELARQTEGRAADGWEHSEQGEVGEVLYDEHSKQLSIDTGHLPRLGPPQANRGQAYYGQAHNSREISTTNTLLQHNYHHETDADSASPYCHLTSPADRAYFREYSECSDGYRDGFDDHAPGESEDCGSLASALSSSLHLVDGNPDLWRPISCPELDNEAAGPTSKDQDADTKVTPGGTDGDCVYVRSEEDKPYIAMIDKIWTDQSGSAFFHGPWFVHPIEVEHSPTRLFYKHEVFRSSIEDTNPMLSIQGKCAVLVHKDYCISRPTELPEHDIYICESKYMEAEKSIRKLAKSMKKPVLSPKVCDDEIYFFKKTIIPQKEPSPLLQKATEEPYLDDQDEDASRPESAENANFPFREELSLDSIPDITPKEKKKKSTKPWQPSGYLVFSAESRKQVQEDNPDLTFGDISKVVGQKWRELPKEDKVRYEEKAKKLAEEHAAKQEAADKAFNNSLAMYPPAQSPNAEASRMSPATNARPMTPGQHANQGYQAQFQQNTPSQGYGGGYGSPQHQQVGLYGPQGAGVAPHLYPASPHHPMAGLTPQSRGLPHPGPASSPGMPPHLMSPHLYPQPHARLLYPDGAIPAQGAAQQPTPAAPPPRPPSPMFVSVPPRTQRLLHSEAYLRYIEGLGKDDNSVGNWERSLTATPENTPLDKHAKLPVSWLGQGVGHHDNTVQALWALRDLMLKDTVSISRTLEFTQL